MCLACTDLLCAVLSLCAHGTVCSFFPTEDTVRHSPKIYVGPDKSVLFDR